MLLRLGIAAAFAAIAVSAQESNLDRFEKKIRPVLHCAAMRVTAHRPLRLKAACFLIQRAASGAAVIQAPSSSPAARTRACWSGRFGTRTRR